MNGSAVQIQISQEIKSFQDVTLLGVRELTQEVRRLKHLRAEANRLNAAAYRDALDAAEAKAPALVPQNAMMRLSEIEEVRAEIEKESQIIGPEVFTLLTDRILLLHGEIGRRQISVRAVA